MNITRKIKPVKITKDMDIDDFTDTFFEKNLDYFKELCAYAISDSDYIEEEFEDFSFKEILDTIENEWVDIIIPKNITSITKLKKWIWSNRESLREDFVRDIYTNSYEDTELSIAIEDYLNGIIKKASDTLDNYLNDIIYSLNMLIPDIRWSYKNYKTEFELKGVAKNKEISASVFLYDQFEDRYFPSDGVVFDVYNFKLDKISKDKIADAIDYISMKLIGEYINLNKSIL